MVDMDCSLLESRVMVPVDQLMSGFVCFSHIYPKMIGSFPNEVTSSQWVRMVPSGS